MQTNFTPDQLRDPAMAASEKILRTCVHCGFCTATCPTYLLLGDELDSPRGRIYLIKDMLEGGKAATPAARPPSSAGPGSIRREAASTSSRTCWRGASRRRRRWSSTSTAASPACPA